MLVFCGCCRIEHEVAILYQSRCVEHYQASGDPETIKYSKGSSNVLFPEVVEPGGADDEAPAPFAPEEISACLLRNLISQHASSRLSVAETWTMDASCS